MMREVKYFLICFPKSVQYICSPLPDGHVLGPYSYKAGAVRPADTRCLIVGTL